MCTNTIEEKLIKLRKKKTLIAYKIVVNIDGHFYSVYRDKRYCFGSNKKMLTWDNRRENPSNFLEGFSIFLNKKEAIKAFNHITKSYANLQLYKVKCSNIVNAGKWGYSVQKNLPFDNINVAEVRFMEFLEKIK